MKTWHTPFADSMMLRLPNLIDNNHQVEYNRAMNKRIQDLALESMVKYIASEAWVFTDGELEKFAELIVRECMRMCDVADMSLLEHNCVKEASGTQSAKDFIKEHFGVQE